MKAKDLMIGDWVLQFGEPRRIVGIRTDAFYPYIKTNMCDTWYAEGMKGLAEPIPLTPEILEKNFKQMSIEDISAGYQDKDLYTFDKLYRIKESDIYQFSQLEELLSCDGVMLRYKEGRFFIDVEASDCDFGAYGATFKEIHHVHELQHVLRLLGIKKEIVL